ncbi:unnamed protein product, partial [Didymodactylos carnosus]
WFAIKDTYIIHMRTDSSEIRFPMLVDHEFQIKNGFPHTFGSNTIKISNLQQTLSIKCKNERQAIEWKEQLEKLIDNTVPTFSSAFTTRFSSFAPIRENQLAY